MTISGRALTKFLAVYPLAIVAELTSVRGSSPRAAGTFMVIAPDGLIGTIGGGALEYMVIARARQALRDGAPPGELDVPLGPEIGQCCGGRVNVTLTVLTAELAAGLVQRLKADEAKLPHVYLFGSGHVGKALAKALAALPLGLLAARNLHAPRTLAWAAKGVLDVLRSIHTLVFGLFFVGIVGLGATAGILAVAAHSAGTLGKLLAESIESLDMQPVEAVRATGATPGQVFFLGVWPAVLPQFVSQALYVWEFNIRDSTILGLVGAGGLGLLLSEAMSLFQWGRLATLLLAIVALVTTFDALSR
eukprot:gene41752-55381_t